MIVSVVHRDADQHGAEAFEWLAEEQKLAQVVPECTVLIDGLH